MMGFGDGSGISWTICKQSAPGSRQITTPIPHHSIFYRPDALPNTQPTVSKQLVLWRNFTVSKIYRASASLFITTTG